MAWGDAKVHVLTHALHYGTGVFEGVRAYETPRGTAVFRHHDHIDRLFQSARLYHMEIPYSRTEIKAATDELARLEAELQQWRASHGNTPRDMPAA